MTTNEPSVYEWEEAMAWAAYYRGDMPKPPTPEPKRPGV